MYWFLFIVSSPAGEVGEVTINVSRDLGFVISQVDLLRFDTFWIKQWGEERVVLYFGCFLWSPREIHEISIPRGKARALEFWPWLTNNELFDFNPRSFYSRHIRVQTLISYSCTFFFSIFECTTIWGFFERFFSVYKWYVRKIIPRRHNWFVKCSISIKKWYFFQCAKKQTQKYTCVNIHTELLDNCTAQWIVYCKYFHNDDETSIVYLLFLK
jgi:hypothetical protein